MICSISAGKCGSNWLDRLRSNKGFPTGDNLDLDHFLKNNDDDDDDDNYSKNPSENRRVQNRKVEAEVSGENGDDKEEWFGIMNNVLSDLFNMGDSNQSYKLSGKKSSRKQTNPKFCLVSTSSVMEEQQSSGCERKGENAQSENDIKEEENVNNVDCGGDNEESERGELLGYSRNEVTVIDTSCPEWKFEKLVYRKRNVWKVREKKGKSRTIGRKRKKGNGGSDGNFDSRKRLKLSHEEGCIFSSKRGQSSQDEKGEEAGKEMSEYPNQVLKKRFLLSRLPKKAKRGGKSAILIKGTSTNEKTGAKSPNSRSANVGIEKQVMGNKALSTTLTMGKGFQD